MFLVAQSTYNFIELGIFQNTDEHAQCLKKVLIDKTNATKLLIPELDKLLSELKIRLSNLDFIAASAGPAPFTTLRVLLSTLNGIAMATNIPLIEINSLEVLLKKNLQNEYKYTLVLLNAFSKDTYYALQTPDKSKIGCANIEDLIHAITNLIGNEKIKIIGNGINIFQTNLKELDSYIPVENPEYTTLQQVADAAIKKWNQQELTAKILPIYLKDAITN
jgi:tRNA threonylcarbamoyladenosine biosynthesis protein TsaB